MICFLLLSQLLARGGGWFQSITSKVIIRHPQVHKLQIAPKNIVNLSNEPIILTDSYSEDNIGGQIITNSITEVLNSFSVNNTYICIGINFKL